MVSANLKKMVELYITLCPKCVSCEPFHLMWPDKSSPLYSTQKQATDLQTSADWYIHVSQAYRQEEKFAHQNCIFPNIFHTLQKISGRAKVCALCIEKKIKAPSGRGKQTKYKCKQCDLPLCHVGFFGNTTSSKMWRCKIRWVGYYLLTYLLHGAESFLRS